MSNYPPRTIRALEQLRLVSGLEGDIIECGVFQGCTTVAMALYLKRNKIDKKIYACDTYGGLPYDGNHIDPMLKKGECTASFAVFWKNVVEAGVEDYIIPVKGLVEDTLPKELAGHKFCFAFLDLDLYEPTSFVARFLTNRIVIGGVMGFHDYKFGRCPGIEIVVDQELDRQKYHMYGDHHGNCAWLQRRR